MVIAAISVIAFDVAAWYLLPDRYNHLFPGFRGTAIGPRAGAGDFPHDYYVNHPTRGFDIGPDRTGMHRVEGVRYPIWSNARGCFDEPIGDLTERPVYFAGDSFTWGFTPYDDKFATLLEKGSGRRVLKCGVTHTGPRHQLDKAKEIFATLNQMPDQILLVFVYNDVGNDYAHPHSAVLDGWQIDRVRINEAQSLVSVDDDVIRKRMAEMIDAQTLPLPTSPGAIVRWVKNYSLSGQILNQLANRVGLTSVATDGHVGADQPMETASGRLTSIYNLDHSGGAHKDTSRFFFGANFFTEPTRQALREWRDFSESVDARFSVILVPDVKNVGNAGFYADMVAYLDDLGVTSVNLAALLNDAGVADADMHWKDDPHWSVEGNRRVADVLCRAEVIQGCDPGRFQ